MNDTTASLPTDTGTLDEFGGFDWNLAGAEIGASPLLIRFARFRAEGLNQTESAKRAGYSGKSAKDWSVAGSKANRSAKTKTLLAMASQYDPQNQALGDIGDVLARLWSLGKGSGSTATTALVAYARLSSEYEARQKLESSNLAAMIRRIESAHPELAARMRAKQAAGEIR